MFKSGKYPVVKAQEVCHFITKGTTPKSNEIFSKPFEDAIPYLKVYNLSFDGEMLFFDEPQYICVTRDFAKVKERTAEIDSDHPEWNYGMFVSNFAEQSVINKAMPGWNIGYNGSNTVSNGSYGPWFAGGCMELTKVCSVYGNQGLELDCPIVVFGGGYVRQNGKWVARGSRYNKDVRKYKDPDSIVENNFRVLLTRARKEMILLIPNDALLDETYQYFIDMGMDTL